MLTMWRDRARNAFNFKAMDDRPAAARPDTALLVVDVQKEYCSPWRPRGNDETRAVTARILETVPQFRRAGVAVYPIYMMNVPTYHLADYAAQYPRGVDRYRFRPARQDTVILKNRNSLFFDRPDVTARLRDDGRQVLLVAGFNLNACVFETAMDARKAGFSVQVLRDLCGNDNHNTDHPTAAFIHRMEKAGITVTDSRRSLRAMGVSA